MDLKLEDMVCVVTGASKGIGLAVTEALVAGGTVVVAGARAVENLYEIERVTSVAVDLGSNVVSSPIGTQRFLLERPTDGGTNVEIKEKRG